MDFMYRLSMCMWLYVILFVKFVYGRKDLGWYIVMWDLNWLYEVIIFIVFCFFVFVFFEFIV